MQQRHESDGFLRAAELTRQSLLGDVSNPDILRYRAIFLEAGKRFADLLPWVLGYPVGEELYAVIEVDIEKRNSYIYIYIRC